MMLQIYSDFNIPVRPEEMTLEMMHFFYDPTIDGLCKIQKNAQDKKGK